MPLRFSRNDYICSKKCEEPNNYVVEDDKSEYVNEFLNECPKDYIYKRKNSNGEYICSNVPCGKGKNDDYVYYFMNINICLKNFEQYYYYENFTENSMKTKKYCVITYDFFCLNYCIII